MIFLNKLVGTNIGIFLTKQTSWYKNVLYIWDMPRDGRKTKTRIIDEATTLVLENGFAGTTIDQILEKTEITKGAFFYHFKTKNDLALGLMDHFATSDLNSLNEALEYVKANYKTPKDQLIGFVQFFINVFDDLEQPYAGCLYASCFNEPEQFPDQAKKIVSDAILEWRKQLGDLIEAVLNDTGAKLIVDKNALADNFTVVMEGGFILSKALGDAKLTANQLKQYRNYLQLLFAH